MLLFKSPIILVPHTPSGPLFVAFAVQETANETQSLVEVEYHSIETNFAEECEPIIPSLRYVSEYSEHRGTVPSGMRTLAPGRK
jgi:hypothetical protein